MRTFRLLPIALSLGFPSVALAGSTALVPPLVDSGVGPKVTANFTSLVSSELDFSGQYDVVNELASAPSSLNASCLTSTSCLGGIAKANSADVVLAGSISPGGSGLKVAMVLYDAKKNAIVRKKNWDIAADVGTAASMAPKMVKEMNGQGTATAAEKEDAAVAKAEAAFSDDDDEGFAFDDAPDPSTKGKTKFTVENKSSALEDAVDEEEEEERATAAAAAEARKKAEAAAKAKADADARARADAEAKARAKAEAEAKARAEAEARAKAEAKARADADAKAAAARAKASAPADDEDDLEAQLAAFSFGGSSSSGIVMEDDLADEEEDEPESSGGTFSSRYSSGGSSSKSSSGKTTTPSKTSTSKTTATRVVVEEFEEDEDDDTYALDDEDEDEPAPRRSSSSSSTSKSRATDDDDDASGSFSSRYSSRASDDDDDAPASSRSSKASTRDDDDDGGRARSSSSLDDDARARFSIAARVAYSRYGDLNFIDYGVEAGIPVASRVLILIGVEGASTNRGYSEEERAAIAAYAGVEPEQVQDWNAILPLNLGVVYKVPTSRVQPYIGADALAVMYTSAPDFAFGGRLRTGVDFLVAENFGFNLDLGLGVLTGDEFEAIQTGLPNFGFYPEIGGGTVLVF